MKSAILSVIGCGDAFCSGGRHQTCFHLGFRGQSILLDFGASALVALRKFVPSFDLIEHVLISHLHGDHFGRLPFFLLDAQFTSLRRRHFTIAGPKGVRKRIEDTITCLFPSLAPIDWNFPLSFVELDPGVELILDTVKITAYQVDHPDPSPALALRLEFDDKVSGFSGDTGWTEALVDVAKRADLFVCECHTYEPNHIHHLDWRTLNANRSLLRAKRVLLTHMSQPMLDHLPTLDTDQFEFAHDGMVIRF